MALLPGSDRPNLVILTTPMLAHKTSCLSLVLVSRANARGTPTDQLDVAAHGLVRISVAR